MRSSYNTGIKLQKTNHTKVFNQIDLNINRVVIILNDNNLTQVVNEKDIKNSIRMYLTRVYDKDNSAI